MGWPKYTEYIYIYIYIIRAFQTRAPGCAFNTWARRPPVFYIIWVFSSMVRTPPTIALGLGQGISTRPPPYRMNFSAHYCVQNKANARYENGRLLRENLVEIFPWTRRFVCVCNPQPCFCLVAQILSLEARGWEKRVSYLVIIAPCIPATR